MYYGLQRSLSDILFLGYLQEIATDGVAVLAMTVFSVAGYCLARLILCPGCRLLHKEELPQRDLLAGG